MVDVNVINHTSEKQGGKKGRLEPKPGVSTTPVLSGVDIKGLSASPPAQTSPASSFSADEKMKTQRKVKGLVDCCFLEEIFEPGYVALSSQSRASSPQLHKPPSQGQQKSPAPAR